MEKGSGTCPKTLMSLSTSWGSQKLLQQFISVMPSPSLRLLPKTCGLFDTGFAGSASDAASVGVKAPASDTLPANDQFLLDLGLGESGQVVSIGGDPFEQFLVGDESGPSYYQHQKPAGFEQQHQQNLSKPAATAADLDTDLDTDSWDMLGDSLADLETNQLADDSLDAFINLDQLLTGDTFLDQVSEVQPVIEMKPQLEPVISIPTPEVGGVHQQFDFFDLLENQETDVNHPAIFDISHNTTPSFSAAANSFTVAVQQQTASSAGTGKAAASATSKGPARKRKSTTKVSRARPCKTSMFEIPISENVVTTTTTFLGSASPQLDHDYTTKQAYPVATLAFDDEMNLTEVVAAAPEPSTSTQVTFVPVQQPDKQTVRRQKNNLASKRSREQRKQKISDLDIEAEELVVKNAALRKEIVDLEKMAKDMKAALVAKMTGK